MSTTGLDEETLTDLLQRLNGKLREDHVLGPIFAAPDSDHDPHLECMAALWSAVTLMTGRGNCAPVLGYAALPPQGEHFGRWLTLFHEAASESSLPEDAAMVTDQAVRIAQWLHSAVENTGPSPAKDNSGRTQ
ncbi:group III truncated hemoglobin [Albidovulum sediminicola]|uniref:Group III truncated hemoglobin n=1 Tax=Albidovulum sediminicola TaxID=2984331 RepID=A0ABT2Z448_9RHOB|nr:group III truncated hemoglobin [Defluviimonas sp. WL0075]MCV2865902.1 group III truncated hemoglobin [Defluviimonas sp. WL0075]